MPKDTFLLYPVYLNKKSGTRATFLLFVDGATQAELPLH